MDLFAETERASHGERETVSASDNDDDDEEGEEGSQKKSDGKKKKKRERESALDTTVVADWDTHTHTETERDSERERERDEDEEMDVDLDRSGLTEHLSQQRGRDRDRESRTLTNTHTDAEEDDDEQPLKIRKRQSVVVDARKEKRQRVRQYYRRTVTYSWSTAAMLLPFVKARFSVQGNVPLDVLWQAILGLTDQFQRGRTSEEDYTQLCHQLKIELGEHLVSASDRVKYAAPILDNTSNGVNGNNAVTTVSIANDDTNTNNNNSNSGTNSPPTVTVSAGGSVSIGGAQTGHIEEVNEFRFFLYRHWSLFESMLHSAYVASKFSVWNSEGKTRLLELLAEIGVPLQQCKQHYPFMMAQFREQFKLQLLSPHIVNKYKLTDPPVTFKSFCRFVGYKNPIAAGDIVEAATALLELHSGDSQSVLSLQEGAPNNGTVTAAVAAPHTEKKISAHDAFHEAYSLLGMRNEQLIKKGVEEALNIQRAIVRKASAMLDGHDSIHRHHRLYYAFIRGNFGSSNTQQASHTSSESEMELIFGRPSVLAKLGQYIMEVKRNQTKKAGGWTGSNLLPLILLSERHDSSYLVMGVSPFDCSSGASNITEEQRRRIAPLVNFRQFFQLAAKEIYIDIRSNSFDPNVVEIRKEDVVDFLGALDTALRKATPTLQRSMSAQ